MRLADAIFQRLKAEGVDVVFYLPGGGAAFLVDALAHSGIEAVCCLHEQGAGYAALAYAQQRGIGVCLVTSGPGATNAITPCAAAWTDGVPVLVISGQANSDTTVQETGLRTRGVQEVDIIPIVKPITKWAHQMTHGEGLGCLGGAIRIAQDGRPGPVWLSVPLDVQAMEVTE